MSPDDDIRYVWRNRASVPNETLEECAQLFSNHYGVWSLTAEHRPGKRIALSPERIGVLLAVDGCALSLAYSGDQLVGHAISLRKSVRGNGSMSWVTQLVVHEGFRKRGIATTLLRSIWAFSDDFGWGLVTANPFTVRTLEKATRRTCNPEFIGKHLDAVRNMAHDIPYVCDARDRIHVSKDKSLIDTNFHIDHSELDQMIKRVQPPKWKMGRLGEGEEWLAFTFREQPRKPIDSAELERLFQKSEQILREAYARMRLDEGHRWARHQDREVGTILRHTGLSKDATVIDFGCGRGRHVLEFGKQGFRATGVDFIPEFIASATDESQKLGLTSCRFLCGDCRTQQMENTYDLGICLYDVYGSFANQDDNLKLLNNLVSHVRPGGFVAISAMNMEVTQKRAKHTGNVFANPDLLLRLPPSNIMQATGNVFDPDYYLVDELAGVVYRKEQFSEDDLLSAELVVRDRRYRLKEMSKTLEQLGVDEIWSGCVRAGDWENALPDDDPRAKEVLIIGRKRG